MTSTDKLIEILTKLKELGLTDEQLNEVGTLFGTAQGLLQQETRGPANAATVTAFGAAAVPLLPLSEELRGRALEALSVLLLPAGPSLLDQLAPAMGPILAAALARGQGQDVPVPQDVPEPQEPEPSIDALNKALNHILVARNLKVVVNVDGSAWLEPRDQ